MMIRQLDMQNFRTYPYASICFTDRLNIIVGNNAEGKTSVLEALALFAYGRSLRAKQDKDTIRFSTSEARLRITLQRDEKQIEMAMKITEQGKQVTINRVPKKNLSEFLGHVYTVTFTPDDLQIIKEGPDVRRHFLTMSMAQYMPDLINHLHAYNQLLTQRNQLMKMRQLDTLDIWDQKMSVEGAHITFLRKKFIEQLSQFSAERYHNLTHSSVQSSEQLHIVYKASCNGHTVEEFTEKLYDALQRSIPTDLQRGFTTVGPHRDDLQILIGDRLAVRFASQGQQRTAVLSLKLALVDLIHSATGQYPVLLLDDVLSELDTVRQEHLFSLLDKTQTILTAAHIERLKDLAIPPSKVFRVSHGIIGEEGA